MSAGAFVRSLFGPYERLISELYRGIYIDVDRLVRRILEWQPRAVSILEVGCGEGAVTQRLRCAYPGASITAIDITPRIGRLYQGPHDGVRFLRAPVEDIAAAQPQAFDLVILSDVVHHVPVEFREGLFAGIRAALAPGGTFFFKDWQKNRSLIHGLCYASDRWLTGDRIHYLSREEMCGHVTRTFGQGALQAEARVGPWWNNLAMLVRPLSQRSEAHAGNADGEHRDAEPLQRAQSFAEQHPGA